MAIINKQTGNWGNTGIIKNKTLHHKKSVVVGGENKSVPGEEFIGSGQQSVGEDLTLFNDQDKLRGFKEDFEKTWKGAGEIEGSKIGQDNQVTGAKPENLSKLEEKLKKYGGHMDKNYMTAIGMGLPGIGVAGIGLAGAAVGGMAWPLGSVMGAMVGSALTGLTHTDRTTITDSGIEKHEVIDSKGLFGNAERVTTYTLPDGTKVTDEVHLKSPKSSTDMASPDSLSNFVRSSMGFKDVVDQSLTALDSEGNKLKADFVKDEKTGHRQIRFENNNGTITTLDPSSMDLIIQSSPDHKEVSTPEVRNELHPLIPDFNPFPYYTTGDAKYNDESIEKKQVIHSDGSTEIILNEKSSFYKQKVADSLHEGKAVEKIIPRHHSYTKVKISSEGDTSVERVDENYRITVDGDTGEIDSKRNKISDKFAGLFRGTLATSLNTQSDFFVGRKKDPEKKGEHVVPFITREAIQGAKDNFTKKNIEESKKIFKELLESRGPDGTIFFADGETGKLRALNPDGTQKWYFDSHIRDGIAAPPLADKENVYVLDKENKLHCINNGHSGFEKWNTEIKGEVMGSPSFDADGNLKVFVELDGRKVVRTINPRTGTVSESKIVHVKENSL